MHDHSLSMCSTVYTTAGKGAEARVRPLSVRRLPSDPRARFEALFSARQRWEHEDLMPYLAGIKVRVLSQRVYPCAGRQAGWQAGRPWGAGKGGV